MDEISLENLKLIINYEDTNGNYLISEGNRLSLIKEDDFDPINNLKSLEYPIYFTYNHLMNKISDNNSISYTHKKNLLNLINYSLDNLYDLIENFEKENKDKEGCEGKEGDEDKENMLNILNAIFDRYDIVRERTLAKRCESLYFLFDDLIETFSKASKYLYFSPCGCILSYNYNDSTDSDYSDDSDDSDDSDKDLKKIDFEGVEYLEDEETRQIYSTSKKMIGKWCDDCTDIIWTDDHDHDHEKNKQIKLD